MINHEGVNEAQTAALFTELPRVSDSRKLRGDKREGRGVKAPTL